MDEIDLDAVNPAARVHSQLPHIPVLPSSHEQPSPLYKLVLGNLENPPLLKGASWTRAAPFKEERHHRTPSESIANNYTPSASGLKIRALRRRPKSLSPVKPPSQLQAHSFRSPPSLPPPMPPGYHRHQGVGIDPSPSRPLTPREQFSRMSHQEAWSRQVAGEPSKRDIERYHYYINEGVPLSDLAPMPEGTMAKVHGRLTERLLRNPEWAGLRAELHKEAELDYQYSLRKAIVDYILQDSAEMARLRIAAVPQAFPRRTLRAPIPWHSCMEQVREAQSHQLFTTNTTMRQLQQLWHSKYSAVHFIDLEALRSASWPMEPAHFEELVQQQCAKARDVLRNQWVVECGEVFRQQRDSWAHLIPTSPGESAVLAEHFFNCACSLMARQLRETVENSLADFLSFLQLYKGGNDYQGDFQDLLFVFQPVLHIELVAKASELVFSPPFSELEAILHRLITTIVESAEKMPRVEHVLFPDLQGCEMVLPCVGLEEPVVGEARSHALLLLQANFRGPQKYLSETYDGHRDLLDGSASHDIDAFLKEDQELAAFGKRVRRLRSQAGGLSVLRQTAYLNLLILDCRAVNQLLAARANELADRLIAFLVDQNRDLNKDLCERYDTISSKVYEDPGTTEEMVALVQFLTKSREETVYSMRAEVKEAGERLKFLLDYATLPEEDLKLNSKVFNWPGRMEPIFDLSQQRLASRREKAEQQVKDRRERFEALLTEYQSEVDTFREKEVMRQTEEVQKVVQQLEQLGHNLEATKQEAMAINNEEEMLEWEMTPFPQIQTIMSLKEPYNRLWTTAADFLDKHERWLTGPFQQLNAEQVEEDVGNMWRTMHKLSRTFAELPGPKRSTELFKMKLDEFKKHIPLLQTFCNPGIRDRHWEKMGEIVGFELKPAPDTPLSTMLEYGLQKHLERLEEIGAAASKEYSLEKALEKMKVEWGEMEFTFIEYRDTGVSILSAVDEVQVLLDDHIVKTQTMRGSPFIKPFEKEIKEWEETLLLIQDILDAWLKCQATWLYLEPIFSSEDIMAQMPEEGRKFSIVDRYWREIMGGAVQDHHALVVTAQANMLGKLQESNRLLEEIQKGLNNYLEKKRLYFPRFFFSLQR